MAGFKLNRDSIDDALIGVSILVSSITFFKEPFEGYLHYLIFFLYLPGFIARYGWQSLSLKFIALPLFTSVFSVLAGDCTFFGFIKVFVGMLLSITFYHYVLIHYDYDFKRLFKVYLKGIIICCYIGIVQVISYRVGFGFGYNFGWLLNKWGVIPGSFIGIRMNSIFSEPSQFALMLLPAVFVACYSLLLRSFDLLSFRNSLLVLGCVVLSTSSTGYVGIFFSILILSVNLGRLLDFLILSALVIVGAYLLYVYVPDFTSRVDASINLWTKDKYTLNDINSSSFVQYNNSHVAWSNFLDHPLFGTGLGSYPIAYEKYSLTKADDFLIKKGFDFNSLDGNSLFFRSLAEMGLAGLLFWIIFPFKFFLKRNDEDETDITWIYSGAFLIIIFGYLLRQGNYFLNGFPFFMLGYFFLYKKYQEGVVVRSDDAAEEDDAEELEEGTLPEKIESPKLGRET